MSSSLTINDLCEDILYLVFDKYLDFKSKLNVQIVCQRFRDLIEQIFDTKRALYLTDSNRSMRELCDEDINKYSVLSIQYLCRLQDGIWLRNSNGCLKLLQPLDIQMMALKRHKNLTALYLVVTTRSSLDSLMDQIINNCSTNLEKLIVINLEGLMFKLNARQMLTISQQYSRLKHFQIFSDNLYASEQCFNVLINGCRNLEVFKLDVRHMFTERIESLGGNSRSVTYDSYRFEGSCFAQSSGQLNTLFVSHPIFDDSVVFHRLPQMVDLLANIRHLAVEGLSLSSMEIIGNAFQSLESISFSVPDSLDSDANRTKFLMTIISKLEGLKKLSIRWFGRYVTERIVTLDYFTLKPIENCRQLKHFVIKEAVLIENSLKAINKYLPTLLSLRIVDCALNKTTFSPIPNFRELNELFVCSLYSGGDLKFKISRIDEQIVDDINQNCIDAGLMASDVAPVPLVMDQQMMDEQPMAQYIDNIEDNLNHLVYEGPFAYEDDHLLWDNMQHFNAEVNQL